MPVTKMMMTIHDDQTGEGTNLAFPTMTSCCACICRLDDRLVGVHKTQGWGPGRIALFDHARSLFRGDAVRELFFVSWSFTAANHDVAQMRNALHCAAVPTYTYELGNTTTTSGLGNLVPANRAPRSNTTVTDVCTLAALNDRGSVVIGLKQSAKVTVAADPNQLDYEFNLYNHGGFAVGQFFAVDEAVTTPSGHMHKIRKFLDFRQA